MPHPCPITPTLRRSALTSHIVARRAEGAPLAQVLAAVNAEGNAEVNALVERGALCDGSPDELDDFRGQVRWRSIDAYLDAPELQHAPLFY